MAAETTEADDETCTDCWGTGFNGNMERVCDCQPKPAPAHSTDLTGTRGLTKAERRGVQRLADRIRFELHCRQDEADPSLDEKATALIVLDKALADG